MKVARVVAPVRAQVVEALRAEIVSGVLAPGQRLVERELCERLDVARNTVREACRQLEAEGFLEIPPHKGPVVAVLTQAQARDVYELREALECFAVRLFAERASDEQVATLKERLGELAAAHRSEDTSAMLQAKEEFYEVLYAGAGNAALESQAGLLQGRLARLRSLSLSRPGRAAQSIAEIEEVVRAIESRDASLASDLWCAHVRNAAASALESP
ncbi:GntR family transcriptional regulator [Streptomyces nanshensis]|uniref:HTH gntR-type domain-containing protein n=1 Tax=Streptomyces nanshensis TaxID=518642 RepID=A0A1E7L3K0_9ACTN|nr:GntR family transcriptional regulator [Streptomyces nanshensis]OEV10767.1 hypothetical protein AN218_15945 [Streptomyces nanshensis]